MMNIYRMYYYSGLTEYCEDEDGELVPNYSSIMSFIVAAESEEQAKEIVEATAWSYDGLTFHRSEIVHLEYPNFVCAVYDRFDE